jgi:hypothetical protein
MNYRTHYLLHQVVKEIPPYFKNHSVPIVSYSYTKCIGRKIYFAQLTINFLYEYRSVYNVQPYITLPTSLFIKYPTSLCQSVIACSRQTIQLGLRIFFSSQFDLNLFMITIETSSIFRLLTKELMLLTSTACLIEKRS